MRTASDAPASLPACGRLDGEREEVAAFMRLMGRQAALPGPDLEMLFRLAPQASKCKR